jgi:RNA polymerase sigma-70 factor (ECF subfamily)
MTVLLPGFLLARAQAGDAKAFEELLAPYRQLLDRYAMRLCNDEEEARDLLQQTIFAAYRGLRFFRGGSKLSTWLCKIARNFWLADRRKQSAALDRMTLLQETQVAQSEEQPRPDTRLREKEISLILRVAINRLSADHREAVVLCDLRGFSTADAATAAGITKGTLKSRLHRAREGLRTDLEATHGRTALLGGG